MGTDELILEDAREARNETDCRVLNGQRRPVVRINIKFYGTLFRNVRELVGLQPEDCFALATYKLHQALQKHESDRADCVDNSLWRLLSDDQGRGGTLPTMEAD